MDSTTAKIPNLPTTKNKVEKGAYFSNRKRAPQLTTFTTHSTTISPQKHHVLHTIFPKNPCKNTYPP
jgi:hypothetical protein